MAYIQDNHCNTKYRLVVIKEILPSTADPLIVATEEAIVEVPINAEEAIHLLSHIANMRK